MPTLRDIARTLGLDADSLPERQVDRVTTLDEATNRDLAYITSDRYLDRFSKTHAGVVIASAKLPLPDLAQTIVLKVKDAELALATVLPLFAAPKSRPAAGVHASAVVDASAIIGENARIGPLVSIAADVRIGNNVILHAGVVIGEGVQLGDDCELFPNVVLRERVRLGNRVIIHANSSLGSDGFGYKWDGRQHAKIPQIGDVLIEDDVEIGSNTCIDRAKFGTTRIGKGTKIDNLVQVGHNVITGQHCILCGQTAIAGSATLGNGVVLGGGVGVTNHVHIADGTTVAARGGISNDTRPGEILAGVPAVPHRDWLKERAAVARLTDLIKTVKRLEAEVDALKQRD